VVLGIGLAILTGVACALFTIASTRVIAYNGSTSTTMALVLGTAGLTMSPLLLAAQPPWLLTRTGCAVVLYIGLVATAAAYLLYGYALGVLPVTVVSTLALAEPACATVLAVALLGETLNGLAGLGLAALTGSLLVMALPDGRGARGCVDAVVDGSGTAHSR
jgi:DME family drug/metabolite transporter